jgi:concentrative nucleoside transporter, CNT family
MFERWTSALGVLVLLGAAFALCPRDLRKHIRWRSVGFGLLLLFAFAVIVLETRARLAFDWANTAVAHMLGFSKEGAAFVFGRLVTDTDDFGFVFAFQVLPTIVFFGAFMALLYHVGVMPFVIDRCARLLARTLGTSGAESLSTVADIFVGQTEAPLVIRPYIARLTRSELMACMTAGFATTGGGVLAAYVLMLDAHVPQIAGHLIACSVMCAPAALVIAKLMLPEVDAPVTLGAAPRVEVERASSLLDAIASGTTDGLRLALNVGAMLVAFLALTALVNFCLGWFGQAVLHRELSLELLLGWLFAPLAFVMGVPAADVTKVASLLGQKTVLNEFVAYSTMSRALAEDPAWLSERGRVIASYALCGFANFGSIGIQIGGYSGLAPERRADFAALGPRAMVGGLLTTCLVATVAGLFV